jgi:hypothetical protein
MLELLVLVLAVRNHDHARALARHHGGRADLDSDMHAGCRYDDGRAGTDRHGGSGELDACTDPTDGGGDLDDRPRVDHRLVHRVDPDVRRTCVEEGARRLADIEVSVADELEVRPLGWLEVVIVRTVEVAVLDVGFAADHDIDVNRVRPLVRVPRTVSAVRDRITDEHVIVVVRAIFDLAGRVDVNVGRFDVADAATLGLRNGQFGAPCKMQCGEAPTAGDRARALCLVLSVA